MKMLWFFVASLPSLAVAQQVGDQEINKIWEKNCAGHAHILTKPTTSPRGRTVFVPYRQWDAGAEACEDIDNERERRLVKDASHAPENPVSSSQKQELENMKKRMQK